MSYFYLALTIVLTVYGQIVLKWQVGKSGPLPEPAAEKFWHMLWLLLNPWILSGFLAAFLASLAWMVAISKLDLSHAYPFVSLTFVLVLILGAVIFHEPFTLPKIAGIGLVMLGVIVSSQG